MALTSKHLLEIEEVVRGSKSKTFKIVGIVFLKAVRAYQYLLKKALRAERRRLKVGKIYKIPILVAPSSIILVAIFLYYFGPVGIVAGVLSLLVHEFAHVLEAKKYNVPTSSVLISAAGAAANMEMNEENHFLIQPEAEWKIAIVGPLMSCLLAAVGYTTAAAVIFFGWDASIPALFGTVNLSLALFNLVPILPLDGGRVFRGVIHQHVYKSPRDRLRFAKRSLEISSSWWWGVLIVSPWVFIILSFIEKARKQEIQNTIKFLKWQIRKEQVKTRDDLELLRLYAEFGWWKTLGLSERPDSIAVLKRAYRKATLAHHPDRGGSAESMRRIRRAYEVGMSKLD